MDEDADAGIPCPRATPGPWLGRLPWLFPGTRTANTDTRLDGNRKTIGLAQRGFACVACHATGAKPALAPFEGQGLNFTYSRDRLTHEWYLRWMLNPQRIAPQSIMPRYSDEEGYSTLTDVLEGDATDQFNAIWQYFQDGKDL